MPNKTNNINLISFFYKRENIYLAIILLVALALRLWVIQLDPFLHDWDERFHALVARNMMTNPFMPILHASPVIRPDYTAWCCNGLWLHKPPLFMWQMALSMRIFGTTLFAMRLPSAIMGTVLVCLMYGIALNASNNYRVALITAVLTAVSHFALELCSGAYGMDHNDTAFCFYTIASIWAFTHYIKKENYKWALFVGIFAGLAVLNKWLTGLVVYSAWALCIAYYFSLGKKINIMHLIISVFTCALVFLPWTIYTLYAYPLEANYELSMNAKHITDVLDGREGNFLFYFKILHTYYTQLGIVILPISIIYLLYKQRTAFNYSLLTIYFIVFLFFTIVVETKVGTFIYVVVPLGFYFIAVLLNAFFEHKNILRFCGSALVVVMIYLLLGFSKFKVDRTTENVQREIKIHNNIIYKNLDSVLPPQYKVVVNCNAFEDVELMFYNKNISAYHYCFSNRAMDSLAKLKVPVATFADRFNYALTNKTKNYPYLYIIEEDLW